MKLAEIIATVEQTRPSSYDKNTLTQWLNELEFQAIDQVFSKHEPPEPPICLTCKEKDTCEEYRPPEVFNGYVYDLDADTELMIPNQFSGTYTSYLYAKIDFNNAELDRYQMDVAMHEAEWQAFAAWYRRTHKPRRKNHEIPVYYKHSPEADGHCRCVQRVEPEPYNN